MSKNDDPAKLLRRAAPFFETQGAFVDAAKIAYAERRKVKPGTRPKHGMDKIFAAIRKFRRGFYEDKNKLPTQYDIKRFVAKTFGYSPGRAKTFARIYTLWNLKGYILLTKPDHAFLESNFPVVWKPFIRRSKFVAKAMAEVRAIEREVARGVNARVAAQPQPTVAAKKRNRSKLISSKDELFKLLGLS